MQVTSSVGRTNYLSSKRSEGPPQLARALWVTILLLVSRTATAQSSVATTAMGSGTASTRSAAEDAARAEARARLVCVGRLGNVDFTERCSSSGTTYHCLATARAPCALGSTARSSRESIPGADRAVLEATHGAVSAIDTYFENQRRREEEKERRREEQAAEERRREEREAESKRRAAAESAERAREDRRSLETIFASPPARIPRDVCGRDASIAKKLDAQRWTAACHPIPTPDIPSPPKDGPCASGLHLEPGRGCVGNAFDRGAAVAALGLASSAASTCVAARTRSRTALVQVTFSPNGEVSSVKVEPPFEGTPEGRCIADKFRAARVPPFDGPIVVVRKPVTVP